MPHVVERQAAPEPGADRHAAALDRARARAGSRTGPTSRPTRPSPARGEGRALAAEPGRRVRARRDREGRASRRRPKPSARELLRRLSFDLTGLPPTPEEVRAFLADTAPGRLRAAGRPPARLAPLRRAHGRVLARPRALRRQRRLPQRQPARRSGRYRDYVIGAFNREPAVRPLHGRAARGRPPAGRVARAADRLRLQPAAPDDRGGRRPAQGVPRHLPRRPRAERLDGVAGRHARLRPVPRPQVRSLPGHATSTASPPSSPT